MRGEDAPNFVPYFIAVVDVFGVVGGAVVHAIIHGPVVDGHDGDPWIGHAFGVVNGLCEKCFDMFGIMLMIDVHSDGKPRRR